MNEKRMIVLDLFSGAGGLSEGFWRNDAKFVGHIEMNQDACDTLKTRTAYWKLKNNNQIDIYNDYLMKNISRDELWDITGISDSSEIINSEISNDTIDELIEIIHTNMKKKNVKNIDIVIGCPPCQSYSLIGRAMMKEKVKDDPRNHLYIHFITFLKEFRPKMFIFENVEGILSAGNGEYFKSLIFNIVENANYHVGFKKLKATDFGVLQNRKRIILIGWNKDCYTNWDNDTSTNYAYPIFRPNKFKNQYVSMCLDDLPKLNAGDKIEGVGKYTAEANEYLIWSKIREKGFNILTQHETRPHNEIDKEIYKIAVSKWSKCGEKLTCDTLSKIRPDLLPPTEKKRFQNRYSVIKPDKDGSHTITAHSGHNVIHPDNEQNRTISIREAARLQSFPDDYYFEGSRTAIFKQIGNAVPPLMAEKIAKAIKKILFKKS